jgi:hypothetical protein
VGSLRLYDCSVAPELERLSSLTASARTPVSTPVMAARLSMTNFGCSVSTLADAVRDDNPLKLQVVRAAA